MNSKDLIKFRFEFTSSMGVDHIRLLCDELEMKPYFGNAGEHEGREPMERHGIDGVDLYLARGADATHWVLECMPHDSNIVTADRIDHWRERARATISKIAEEWSETK